MPLVALARLSKLLLLSAVKRTGTSFEPCRVVISYQPNVPG